MNARGRFPAARAATAPAAAVAPTATPAAVSAGGTARGAAPVAAPTAAARAAARSPARASVRASAATAAVALLPLLAGCGPAAPWTEEPAAVVALRLQVAPAAVAPLEPVTLTFDLWTRGGAAADFAPELPAADWTATRRDEPARPLFGGSWRRTVLQATPKRAPGELAIPAFTARLREGAGEASSPAAAVTVRSVVAPDDDAIEAPGEPFPTPPARWPWLLAGGALLLGGGLLVAANRRRRVPTLAIAPTPPHVRALRELERLRQRPRATAAEVAAFYVAVSQVLRDYLEARFGLRAPERTTEEFLRDLEAGDALAKAHRADLEAFLSQCDLVKFAAVVPSERDHEVAWRLAAAFVEATRGDRTAPQSLPATASLPSLASPAAASALSASPLAPPPLPSPPPTRSPEDRR
jgi:hypothetical protein